MWAGQNGGTGVVKVLLENGADIHAKDNDGQIIIIILIHYFHNLSYLILSLCGSITLL